jgi:hypothetical protein
MWFTVLRILRNITEIHKVLLLCLCAKLLILNLHEILYIKYIDHTLPGRSTALK